VTALVYGSAVRLVAEPDFWGPHSSVVPAADHPARAFPPDSLRAPTDRQRASGEGTVEGVRGRFADLIAGHAKLELQRQAKHVGQKHVTSSVVEAVVGESSARTHSRAGESSWEGAMVGQSSARADSSASATPGAHASSSSAADSPGHHAASASSEPDDRARMEVA
jgi:hypothetical protein